MLVGERMRRNPVTVTEDVGIGEALRIMHENKVRRLPVLNRHGKLVGIVSEKDLLQASPSPATSLSIFELNYLLSKLTVKKVMTSPVITVDEQTPLEEAARIMADNRIGGLPVMRGDELVGIITETDLFKIFLELLGARDHGVRLTLEVPDRRGLLADLTSAIAGIGGNIISLGTFAGNEPGTALVTVKVADVTEHSLLEAIAHIDGRVIDIRTT
ncbi:MAG: CBS and ACT domain-containing protein [Anaerolineae bacterium]|nr:CBS domain-containing protein [Anaerolineae bacterium]MDW8099498.1 CBS and ACT domain-containing protein [Anaerolineae bacterium]